jgi:hypothetical protein
VPSTKTSSQEPSAGRVFLALATPYRGNLTFSRSGGEDAQRLESSETGFGADVDVKLTAERCGGRGR